jgi:hypothetical protein
MKRKIRTTIAAAAVGLAAFVTIGTADAAFITGQLSISGTDTVNYTGDTITFGLFAVDINGSGDFAPFVPGTPVTMRNINVANSYAGQDLTAGSNLTCGTGGVIGGCVFQTTLGALTAGFDLDAYSFVETGAPTLDIQGSGFAYLTGFDPTPGTFLFTTQGNGTVSFSATVAVPGPIMGAGLPGLIAACGGLLALARRRRQKVA